MKKLIPILLISMVVLYSCTEKTAENSFFSKEISELDDTYKVVDSNYSSFLNMDVDTMIHFRNLVTEKYKKIKEVYRAESVDTSFEKIMLIARGQFTKKLGKIGENSKKIEEEYKKSTKQYSTLRENLVHENIEENKALTYFNEEKQALILLNAEIVNFNQDLSNTIYLAGVIIPQLDSIIEVHNEKE